MILPFNVAEEATSPRNRRQPSQNWLKKEIMLSATRILERRIAFATDLAMSFWFVSTIVPVNGGW